MEYAPDSQAPVAARSSKSASKSHKAPVELQALRVKLRKAIECEAYEDAAVLRDKIRILEKKDKREKKSG